MKIQLGKITMNKTRKYLVPCLKAYGSEFERRISSVWKVAIGVGDMVTIKSNIILEKHLFILCEANKDPESFINFIDWIKEKDEIYEDDYIFDDIHTGCLHMIVIKLPEDCYHVYETFLESKFSKMYTEEELKKFFETESDTKKVLIKDHAYKLIFSKAIKDEYKVDISPNQMDEIGDDFELDFPLDRNEEIFNTHLT